MLKAMLKKQLLELSSFYLFDRKTGKRRSKAGMIGFILLFVFLYLTMGITFFGMAYMLSEIVQTDMNWLYFAMMSLIAICLGVFGSVFNTYAALWHAKDNEMLLSMPIRPSVILFVRLLGVVIMSALYSGLVLVPVIIARLMVGASFGVVMQYVWMSLMVLAIVTVLTTALGWLVAVIAARFKNKSWLTTILSMGFLLVYFAVCFNAGDYLENFMVNAMAMERVFREWLGPFYWLGRAAEGDMTMLAAISAVVIALCVVVWLVMTRTFAHIVGSSDTGSKVRYRERRVRSATPFMALYRKEMKRFTASSTYMLNCGMGLPFLVIGIAALIVKRSDIAQILPMLRIAEATLPNITQMIPLAGALMICMILAMTDISAPSVSMEGNNLWVVQTLPISAWQVLQAKAALHLSLVCLPSVAAVLVMGWVLGMQVLDVALMLALVLAFMVLTVVLGLMLNLLKPDLNWTNETYAVKQSMSVIIVLLGGWVLVLALGAGGFFLREMLSTRLYMGLCALVLTAADVLITMWLKNKGAKILEQL